MGKIIDDHIMAIILASHLIFWKSCASVSELVLELIKDFAARLLFFFFSICILISSFFFSIFGKNNYKMDSHYICILFVSSFCVFFDSIMSY